MEQDKGWAWIIMVGGMIATLIENGTFKTFGIFFVAFLENLHASVTATALVQAVFHTVYSLTVLPVMNYAVERYSCRRVVIFGGIVFSLSYFLTSFATNIEFVILCQGVLSAIGSASIHGPSLLIIGRYFKKRRSFATSMAFASGSVGGIVFPILFTEMMMKYSLQGALWIQSSILLNCVVAGALFRPIHVKELSQDSEEAKPMQTIDDGNMKNDDFDNTPGTLLNKEILHCSSKSIGEEMNVLIRPENSYETNASGDIIGLSDDGNTKLFFEQSPSKTHTFQCASNRDLYSASLVDYYEKDTSNPDKDRVKKQKKYISFSLSKIIDFSVFKNKLVVIFAVAYGFGSICTSMPPTFLALYARQRGLSEFDLATLAAVLGGSDFLGRICCGIFADFNLVQRYKIIMYGLIICGTILQFSYFISLFWHFVVYSVIYGLFGGVILTLFAPACADLFGISTFHKALGVAMMMQGITMGISGAFVGMLRDLTGNYIIGFHVMGFCGLFAASLLLCVSRIRKRDNSDQ